MPAVTDCKPLHNLLAGKTSTLREAMRMNTSEPADARYDWSTVTSLAYALKG